MKVGRSDLDARPMRLKEPLLDDLRREPKVAQQVPVPPPTLRMAGHDDTVEVEH